VEAPAVRAQPPAEPAAAPPETRTPETRETKAPETKAQDSAAPETKASEPKVPEPKAPEKTADAPVPTAKSAQAEAPTPSASATVPTEPVHPSTLATQSPTVTSVTQSPTRTAAEAPPSTESPSAPTAADVDHPHRPTASHDDPVVEPAGETDSASTPAAHVSTPTTGPTTAAREVRRIETLKPQTLDAPHADIEVAKAAPPVELKPPPAPAQDVRDLAKVVNVASFQHDNRPDWDRRDNRPDWDHRDDRRDWDRHDWDNRVRQWQPDWVQYDEYYRPVLCNPYHDTVRVVYVYRNQPRIVYIPPMQRIVMEVADLAAYSFTAVVVNAVNTAANVAVGSFFGGGYYPGVGMPPPPPPPPVLRYDNVPVQVRYSDATYQPFRVQRIVDVGDDTQYGEHKVLLDGVTPAWGQWTQNPSGERQFEVHKTQQFPGLDEPREAPLPGDYKMQLVSDQQGLDDNTNYLIIAAVTCGVLSLGAVGLSFYIGRRRREV
jgi:hypothetical protein